MASALVSIAGGAGLQAGTADTIATTTLHLPQGLALNAKYVCAS